MLVVSVAVAQGRLYYIGCLVIHKAVLGIPHKAHGSSDTRWLGALCITRHNDSKHRRWDTSLVYHNVHTRSANTSSPFTVSKALVNGSKIGA